MKANRFAGILDLVRAEGDIGIDACSPREVALAVRHGFRPTDISVTASMLSTADLAAFVAQGVHLNVDCLSAVTRYAALVPRGTGIGLRVDTAVAIGYGITGKMNYGGGKLGLVAADVVAVAEHAAALGLVVDTLHVHAGWGIAETDADAFAQVLYGLAALARQLPSVRTINVGGGLGARLKAADVPLDALHWGELLATAFADLDVTIACEPGTFVVSQAGLLVTRVHCLADKGAVRWAGIDAGLGINVYAAHYAAPLAILPVAAPTGAPDQPYAIAGNINEAADIFGREVPLPPLQEGDLLALFPAGAYGSSMASDHCLRGGFAEQLV